MSQVLDLVKSALADRLLSSHSFRDDDTILIRREDLPDAAKRLKEDPDLAFDVLMDLTVVDYIHDEERFEVVYHLLSFRHNHRLRVKVRVREDAAEVPSVVTFWPIADWLEREAWDMYGVRFTGHPNLSRILMYEPFEGHPLRKDYPHSKRQPLIGPKN